MARGQLQSIINNAQKVHDMLKDKDNLPEWVQSKITLAEDYISTVANYMMSELDEEVMQEGIQDEPHEIVHKETGKTVSTHKNYKDAYSAYQDLSKASDHAIGHIPKKTNEEVKPITELSSDTLDRYKEKAKKSSDSLTSQGKYRQANDRTMNVMKATGKQINKTVSSIRKALNRESVVNEVMDEPNYSSSIQARQKKAEIAKKTDAVTPAQLSLKPTPKKLETPVYESRQLEIVREAMADAKKKDAIKKKEQKVNPGGDDKFQSEPELTSSITKNA
jgi:3-methyladenine DNA glycosylase Tag